MSQPSDELASPGFTPDEFEHLGSVGELSPSYQQWYNHPTDQSSPMPRTESQSATMLPDLTPAYSALPPVAGTIAPFPGLSSQASDAMYSSGYSASAAAVSVQGVSAYSEHTRTASFSWDSQSQQNSPPLHTGAYGSPIEHRNPPFGFDPFYPWGSADSGNPAGGSIFGAPVGAPEPRGVTPPAISFESLARTPEGGFSNLSLTAYGEHGNTVQAQPRVRRRLEGGAEEADVEETLSPSKRAKKEPELDFSYARVLPAGRPLLAAPSASSTVGSSSTSTSTSGGGSGSSGAKIKLRSASRSSKNAVHRPDETMDAQKARNSHNLVEKQYRNRLNAQFETLLNALPDKVRSPRGEPGPNLDFGERQLSKGDVLDMSTRYIKTLEKDCGRLGEERDELSRGIEQLRARIPCDGMAKIDGSDDGEGICRSCGSSSCGRSTGPGG